MSAGRQIKRYTRKRQKEKKREWESVALSGLCLSMFQRLIDV